MKGFLHSIRIVLCRPEGSLNLGAVCRSMKTMGISKLTLVLPASMDQNLVYKMALHAREIYDQAKLSDNLKDALKGSVLSAGITRRQGQRRKWVNLLPEQLAERASTIAEGEIALVFGNEQSGLSNAELRHCHLSCHIPSSPDFPSLNLSHAVQIITSVFYRQSLMNLAPLYHPIPYEKVEHLVDCIHHTLEEWDYFHDTDRFHTDRYFRDILARAMLSSREAEHMEKIFSKLRYLKTTTKLPGVKND